MSSDRSAALLIEEIESFAVQIAGGAGKLLMEQFNQPHQVEFKGKDKDKKRKTDPVTAADRRSEEYLKTAIAEKFPGHAILGEEGASTAAQDSPFLWVLDPLDGTANFMNGLPLFAVSVGVLKDQKPVAGAIYVTVSNLGEPGIYHARKGNGTFLGEKKLEISAASSERPLSGNPAMFRRRPRGSDKKRRMAHESRNLGSIALELALTSGGILHYSLFGGPKIWDVAAGVLLVQEAGGEVFTCNKGDRAWSRLEIFQTKDSDTGDRLEQLRKWSGPVIAGAADVAGDLAREIRPPNQALSWLRRLRHRYGHKKGQAG